MKRIHKIAATMLAAMTLAFGSTVLAQPATGMGHGFGPMGGMHGAMGRGGPMAGGDSAAAIDAHMSKLKAQLQITASQETAWQAFTGKAKEQAQSMKAMQAKMQDSGLSAPDRMAQHTEFMKQRVANMEAMHGALQDLYAVFTPDQKAKADKWFGAMHGRSMAANPQRQAEVARLGADVMPFSVQATTHIFTKTADGGTQRVVAKDPSDAPQIRLVRAHLREIASQFRKGDFSGPSHVHGDDMRGLVQLKAAKPGDISIAYRDVKGGAELTYRTRNAELVSALHAWFDAQLSDHGADAMAGHHHHGNMSMQ